MVLRATSKKVSLYFLHFPSKLFSLWGANITSSLCRFLFQCESSLPTSSPTSCMCRTTPPPYLEPAWRSASGFSPPRRKSCSTTTRSRWVTSFTRFAKTSRRLFSLLAFFLHWQRPMSVCAGYGRREERLHQSRAEVLPAGEAGRAEEDVHGQSLPVINKFDRRMTIFLQKPGVTCITRCLLSPTWSLSLHGGWRNRLETERRSDESVGNSTLAPDWTAAALHL